MKHTFLILSFFALLLSCGSKNKSTEKTGEKGTDLTVKLTQAQLKNAGIETMPLQTRQISSVLKMNGKIDVPPQNIVSISIPMGGYLKSTQLLPGMHIRKGETIAVIEDQQYIQLQQDYLTAKAKIGFLENEYLRQKELNESKASSDKSYQLAEAEYKSQKVLISALAEKLKLAGINIGKLNENNITRSVQVYSPIDGFVSKVNVNIGKYVAPTEVLFELINPTDIHLNLMAFEKDVNKLFIGQKLVAYTNNDPQKKYDCEVLLIGKDLTDDGTTDVHCHFHSYDKALIPGTYMNAEIDVKNNQALVLPEDAVVRYENKHYVFVKKTDDTFEMIEVKVGATETGFTEIITTENEKNKTFVSKGAYTLLMSLKNKADE
jgi:membrane fusion protein, heavy metal efflux system